MSRLVLVCLEIEMGRERICVWPCGTWCWESEVAEYTWMSDDYIRVELGDDEDPEDVAARTQA